MHSCAGVSPLGIPRRSFVPALLLVGRVSQSRSDVRTERTHARLRKRPPDVRPTDRRSQSTVSAGLTPSPQPPLQVTTRAGTPGPQEAQVNPRRNLS
jgi:hypothetical protein